MTCTRKSGLPPPLSAWDWPPLRKSTCSQHEIHINLLKQLVQWPSRTKVEFPLYYDCNLFKTERLVIYIDERFPLFILSKDEILVQNTPTSLHEKQTRGWCQWALIFCEDVHMELTSYSNPHASTSAGSPSPPCGRHKRMAPYENLHQATR